MKNFIFKASLVSLLISGILTFFIVNTSSVFAATNPNCNKTNPTSQDLNNCLKTNGIVTDLNNIVKVLSGLAGIAIVGTIILGGIQYSAAGDKPEALQKAKQRITNGLLALGVFLLIFAFLQWIIPGGIFNSP
jgi:flagellar biosynthesis protein FlhB